MKHTLLWFSLVAVLPLTVTAQRTKVAPDFPARSKDRVSLAIDAALQYGDRTSAQAVSPAASLDPATGSIVPVDDRRILSTSGPVRSNPHIWDSSAILGSAVATSNSVVWGTCA